MIQTPTLFITGIVSFALLLFALQIKFRKISKNNGEGKLKFSFSIWAGALYLSSSFMLAKMLSLLNDALTIYMSYNANIWAYFKTISIFIGLTIASIIALNFLINVMSFLIFEDRKEIKEMENDNISYFILKSILIIGSTIALLPALESLLKLFFPVIQTPFYH
jgi:hypothetical protein